MRKLMGTAGLVLGAGILVLAGAGVLVLAGAGVATARPASTSACQQFNSTVASLDSAMKQGASNAETSLKSKVDTIASELEQAVASGSAALKSAVSTFATDIKAAVPSHHFNSPKINSDIEAIVAACATQAKAPRGAPATGGGSAAGVQDSALFGLGGAAVLAGVGTLGLARRNRPSGDPGQG